MAAQQPAGCLQDERLDHRDSSRDQSAFSHGGCKTQRINRRHETSSEHLEPPHASPPRSLRLDATKKKRGGPPNHDQGRRQSLRSIAAPQINLHGRGINIDAQNALSTLATDRSISASQSSSLRVMHATGGHRAIYECSRLVVARPRTFSPISETMIGSRNRLAFPNNCPIVPSESGLSSNLRRDFFFCEILFSSPGRCLHTEPSIVQGACCVTMALLTSRWMLYGSRARAGVVRGKQRGK